MPTLKVISARYEDVFADVARVDKQFRPKSKAGSLIAIQSGTKKVIAIARGPAKNQPDSTIAIDEFLRDRLSVKNNEYHAFSIRNATFREQILWAFSSANAAHRVAVYIAAISLTLGAGSLGLSLALHFISAPMLAP